MAITTFFPDPDPESTSVDGSIGLPNVSTWSGIRDATTATASADGITLSIHSENETTNKFSVHRAFLLFDTSSIPDGDTIDSATTTVTKNTGISENPQTSGLIQTSPASDTTLVNNDFDNLTLNSPSEATDSRVDMNVADDTDINYVMNATGLGFINATGITKLGIRFTGDIDDVLPPNNTRRFIQVHSVEIAGTNNDPKLVVTHTSAHLQGGPTGGAAFSGGVAHF